MPHGGPPRRRNTPAPTRSRRRAPRRAPVSGGGGIAGVHQARKAEHRGEAPSGSAARLQRSATPRSRPTPFVSATPGGGSYTSPRARRVQGAQRRIARARRAQKLTSPFTPDEAAALIRKVGGTDEEARALSTKVMSESGGRKEAVGHDPGGTTGLGIWQITTGVGNEDVINRYGGPQAMMKPKPNARAALSLLRSGGLGNWYGASGPAGDPNAIPTGRKPNKRDLRIVKKAGLPTRPTQPAKAGGKPFKKAAAKAGRVRDPAKLVNPKWDPDSDEHSLTILAKGISPVVRKWAKKYNVSVGEAKAESGHVSPGHLVTGTATDVYPAQDTEAGWDRLEQGLRVLVNAGFEVGYGTNGVGEAWSNHGRHNHAHIEWAGQGSASDALTKLAGTPAGVIRRMEQGSGGTPSGVGSFSASDIQTYAGATGSSMANARAVAKKNPKKMSGVLAKLRKIRSIFANGNEAENLSLSDLERRYGKSSV